MTIRRRGKSKRWTVEVYDPSKASRKWQVGTFDSQQEARAAGRLAESRIAARKGRRADTTVAEFAARWLELHPRQKESTNTGYAAQIKPFVSVHGAVPLRDVTVEIALEWALERRWTLGGVRAMFSDARRRGLVGTNPFTNLRLRGSLGRKNLDVPTRAEVEALAGCAHEVWSGEVAHTMYALVSMAAFVGMRPGELYGLRWSDVDLRNDEIHVQRQYSKASRSFELPKNGKHRDIALTGPAKAALTEMPRPLDADELIFRASRGGPITGGVQHYYWHPIRCRFGKPSMDLYELRHFCASWLFNDLALPAQDVAHQLGHTDGGALVQRLYGHPSERLARERIKRATGGRLAAVTALPEAERRHD
ncbi:MAG: site-specific integrase [Actinomycetota bacterium]|nr:site-specific integrase [Actinomycetota bacterium]